MKSNAAKIISILMCLALVLAMFAGCKGKEESGSDDVGTGSDSWSQGVPATKVDLTAEELTDLVKQALGDDAKDFDGDLLSLTSDQLALVKAKADELGYYFTKNDDGTISIQKSVALATVSDGSVVALVEDALGKDTPKDFDGDLSALSDDQIEKVKDLAEKEDVYIVEDAGKTVAKVDTAKASSSSNSKYHETATTTAPAEVTVINGTTKKSSSSTTRKSGSTGGNSPAPAPANSGSGSGGKGGSSSAKTDASTTSAILGREIIKEIVPEWLSGYEAGTSSLTAIKASGDSVVAAGTTIKNGNAMATITKFNKNGKKDWSETIQAQKSVYFEDLTVLDDNSILAVGYSFSDDLKKYDAKNFSDATINKDGDGIIAKYKSNGSLEWVRVLGGSMGDTFLSVEKCPDGGIVVGGAIKSTDGDFASIAKTGSAQTSAVIMKFTDSSCTKLAWAKTMTSSKYASASGLAVDKAGNVFTAIKVMVADKDFAAIPNADIGSEKTLVVKYKSDGTFVWQQTLCASGRVEMESIAADGNGGCAVAGYYSAATPSEANNYGAQGTFAEVYNGGNAGSADGAVAGIGADGSVEWITVFNGFYTDFVKDITATSRGYMVVGYSNSTNRDFAFMPGTGDYDAFVCAMSKYGGKQYVKAIGGSDADKLLGVCVVDDTTIAYCGSTSSSDADYGSMSPSGSSSAAASYIGKATLVF